MKRFLKIMRDALYTSRGLVAAALFVALWIAASEFTAYAQSGGMVLPPNTGWIGFMSAQGKSPVATGCTLTSGSTDAEGTCTATTTSGAIVFAKTDLVNIPFCIVVDQTASPVIVYATTALQITLTTIVNAHVLHYRCDAQAGL